MSSPTSVKVGSKLICTILRTLQATRSFTSLIFPSTLWGRMMAVSNIPDRTDSACPGTTENQWLPVETLVDEMSDEVGWVTYFLELSVGLGGDRWCASCWERRLDT